MVQDLIFLLLRHSYRGKLNSAYATISTRTSARKARVVVCPSEQTRALLVDRFRIAPEKTTVIPNGVADLFFNDDEHEPEHYADPYFLFVGTFEARKGLDVLKKAVPLVRDRTSEPFRLVLAGRTGWGADADLRALRGRANVEVVESPTDEQLARLYSRARALVFPSRMEGFGLPVAEAMASGAAVITSDLPCVREFAGPVPTYVPAGDAQQLAGAMSAALENGATTVRDKTRHREQIQGLRWNSIGERTAGVIEHAVVGE
jgi:alpha-1,3-rhamnosyl/mannosyltransferase